jgi:hypothetical protein
MLTRPFLAVLVAGGLFAAGCANPQPVRQFGLNRDTPQATYEYFKAAAAANQWAAEWSVFSPNAKRQADQLAGRHVDLGDYSMARQTPIGNNSTREMQMLLTSRFVATTPVSDTVANVTIAGSGRQVTVRMIKLTSWELRLKGEEGAEPLGGFVRSAADHVAVNADGSITVRVQPPGDTSYLRTIPRERIDGFAIKSMWYVDDLSSLQNAVSGMGTQQPAPEQPTQPAPEPPPSGDFGSPG